MKPWYATLFFASFAYFAWDHFVHASPLYGGAGAIANHTPVQGDAGPHAPVFEKNGFRVAALATFAIEARVIRSQTYCCNGQDKLAPIDVVFGWGKMSDDAVLARIDIRQSGRFYFWRYEGLAPIPRREIETSSANMHLIPATSAVERQLKSLRPGSVVTLKGYLVAVSGPGGFQWRSSLTREDTGDGACEIIWVEDIFTA